jgi:hypothetical protein
MVGGDIADTFIQAAANEMTLSVVHSSTKQPWFILDSHEDHCLRDAFGRFGTGGDKTIEASEQILEKYRRAMGGKCWFACDCREGEDIEPPLLTIAGKGSVRSHLRRMASELRSSHALECDFWLERWEQAVIAKSYVRTAASDQPILIPVIPITPPAPHTGGCPEPMLIGPHTERPVLGRLLAELFVGAGLQTYGSEETLWPVTEQYKVLRQSAARIELRPGVPLIDYFHTYAPTIWHLRKKIESASATTFAPAPAHGLFVGIADKVAGNRIGLRLGDEVYVTNNIHVFSNLPKADVPGVMEGLFIAAIVFVSRNGGRAEAVDAYLHPVLSGGRLMLLSNEFERLTVHKLRSVQKSLKNKNVLVDFEKPLFLEAGVQGVGPLGIIPDFVATRQAPAPSISIPIDVTCSERQRYRAMKLRQSALLSAAYGKQTISHDCTPGVQEDASVGDEEFVRQLCRALSV